MEYINKINNNPESYNPIIKELNDSNLLINKLKNEISKVIVGNQNTIDFILLAIITNGHVLLEGVPGVAKTTIIKTICNALGLDFKRIQFTPDLLPSDLIGTQIFNSKIQDFETKKGPIFSNIILADEINRAPAKVQSALLEVMQEHQVTIGSNSYILEEPFFVFATQNPIEQQGTYSLPEAQLDRFMFKLIVDYPTIEEEKEIINKINTSTSIKQIIEKIEIFKLQEISKLIYIDEKIVDYIVKIVNATRKPELFCSKEIASYIQHGASPRATLALYQAAKAYAFLKMRHFVIPDDVKFIANSILRHRIGLSYEAQAENISSDYVINKILHCVPTP